MPISKRCSTCRIPRYLFPAARLASGRSFVFFWRHWLTHAQRRHRAVARSRAQDPFLWYGIGILYDRCGSFENAEEVCVFARTRVLLFAPALLLLCTHRERISCRVRRAYLGFHVGAEDGAHHLHHLDLDVATRFCRSIAMLTIFLLAPQDPKFEKVNEIYFRLGLIYKNQMKYDQCLEVLCLRPVVHQLMLTISRAMIARIHANSRRSYSASMLHSRICHYASRRRTCCCKSVMCTSFKRRLVLSTPTRERERERRQVH